MIASNLLDAKFASYPPKEQRITQLDRYTNTTIPSVESEVKKMKDNICDLCKGSGIFLSNQCVFCNGTGEWNQAAQGYIKNHICQCIILDRKFCPVCNKPCHHDTTLNPKQKIDPGYGGMSSRGSYKKEVVAL